MKKLTVLLLVVLLTGAMMVPVSADGANEILKGTPVVDGVLDDIYLQSASTIQPDEALGPYVWGDYDGELYNNGRAYLLWDEDFLYVCTVMEDITPFSAGEGAGWQNDCSEHWFNDEQFNYKVHIAADGNFFLGSDADGITPYDFEASVSAAQWTDDTHFCTEIALPLNNLAAGREFTYKMQYNNIVGSDINAGYAISTGEAEYVCSATEVVLTAVEPEAELEVEPEAELEVEPEVEPEAESEVEPEAEPVVETETLTETEAETVSEKVVVVTAPKTFDASLIAVVMAVVSAAGYAVSKKR